MKEAMALLVGYRTIIFALVAFLSELSARFGITIDADGTTNSIITLASIVLAIWFKYKANVREKDLKALTK